MRHRLLLVDDHQVFLEITQRTLSEYGFAVDIASTREQALALATGNAGAYSVYVLDYLLDQKNGAQLAREIRRVDPESYIVIYSNDESREALKESLRASAQDFIDKSAPLSVFVQTLRRWCEVYEAERALAAPSRPSAARERIASIGLVGQSTAMAHVAELVHRYRGHSGTVLLLGATGTGKEQIAHAVHGGSSLPFRAVNCASFSGNADLLETELFGVERGAFTGANHSKKGILEDVDGGTLFLDEVHTLSLQAQQKLLRALQERKVRRVGTTREYDVRFRLVAAAKPDLSALVAEGAFLPDLYHRLQVLVIQVPALRERPEDVGLLFEHFANEFRAPGRSPKRLLTSALDLLQRYSWPGNVRELKHVVERLSADVAADVIAPGDLDAKFRGVEPEPPLLPFRGGARYLDRKTIEYAIETSRSMRAAARRLGVPHSTLHDLMRSMGIPHPRKRGGG
jgi:DNA-binding NtrC family response regulator